MPAVRESFYYAQEDGGLTRWWTPTGVDWALDRHAAGDFRESAKLAADFARDKRIPGIRSSVVNGFVSKTGLPFTVSPPDVLKNKKKAAKFAREVGARWTDWIPEDALSRMVEDFTDLGVAVARVYERRTASEWHQVVDPWPMDRVWWEPTARQWRTTDDNGQSLVITPGQGWLVVGSARARSWQRGAVLPVGMALVERYYVNRSWIRWCERHGNPLLVIEEPSGDDTDKTKVAAKAAFFQRMVHLSSRGVVRAPKGDKAENSWGVRFEEPTGNGWEGCKALIDKTDTDIAIAYTGQNLTSEVTGGSLAAANVHMIVRGDFLGAIAEQFATCTRAQLVVPWGRANLAGWDDKLAPWPLWDTTPPEPRIDRAKRQQESAKAARLWRLAGADVDIVQMAKDEGVPLASDDLLPASPETAAERVVPTTPDQKGPADGTPTLPDPEPDGRPPGRPGLLLRQERRA